VNILYHEATFQSEDEDLARKTFHSTSAQAADIARTSGAGMLLLGHFSSRYKNVDPLIEEARAIFPETTGVNDGDVFEIERLRAASH
jgi:ribonuclease Z